MVSYGGGFALDQHQHLFCNNSVILISPDENIVNSYFLLAVLNSKVFQVWAQHRMPTLGSGWRSYRVSVLRKFPLPTIESKQNSPLFEEIADLAEKLLNEKLNGTDHANILSTIDGKVCELYGISKSNVKVLISGTR